jgi:RNA polymerase sigma-70 factor (ECF subfamily)
MDRGEEPEADPLTGRFVALSDRLTGTAYFVLGHREDAREAVQEAFVRCWRARASIAGVADLDAWVFSVVLNVSKDLRRRRRVRAGEPLPTEDAMPLAARDGNPGAAVERADAIARVREVLPTLPEAEREVFLLRQNGELTFEAIAAAVGCPVGTAKTRMRAALRRLREALDPADGVRVSPALRRVS